MSAAEAEQVISSWLKSYLADLLSLPEEEIDESTVLQRYGLDSSAAVGLAGDLGDWLGYELDPTITYDHPSIRALSAALSQDAKLLAALGVRKPTLMVDGGLAT